MRSRIALIVASASLALGVLAPSAVAHTALARSNPADGSTLDGPPTRIVLTFNEPPLSEGLAVVATDASGTTTRLADVRVEGSDVIAPWPGTAASGRWQVAYRVVADDGHPIEGTISFTINAPSPSSSTPTPTRSSTPTPTRSPTPVSTSPLPSPSPTTTSSGPSVTWPVGLIAALVALALVVGAAVVLRRRGDGDRT